MSEKKEYQPQSPNENKENLSLDLERIGKEYFGEKILERRDRSLSDSLSTKELSSITRKYLKDIKALVNKRAEELFDSFYKLYYQFNIEDQEKLAALVKGGKKFDAGDCMKNKGLTIEDLLIGKKDIDDFFPQEEEEEEKVTVPVRVKTPEEIKKFKQRKEAQKIKEEAERIKNEIIELFYLSNSLDNPSPEAVFSILRILKIERDSLKKKLGETEDKNTRKNIREALEKVNNILIELLDEDVIKEADEYSRSKIVFNNKDEYINYIETFKIKTSDKEYRLKDLFKIKLRADEVREYFEEEWNNLPKEEKLKFEKEIEEIKNACGDVAFYPYDLSPFDLYIDKRLAETYQIFKDGLGEGFLHNRSFIENIKNIFRRIDINLKSKFGLLHIDIDIKRKIKKKQIGDEEKDITLQLIKYLELVPAQVKKGLAFEKGKAGKITGIILSGLISGGAGAGIATGVGLAAISAIPFFGGVGLGALGAIALIERRNEKIIIVDKEGNQKPPYEKKTFKETISYSKKKINKLNSNLDIRIRKYYDHVLVLYKREYIERKINEEIEGVDSEEFLKKFKYRMIDNVIGVLKIEVGGKEVGEKFKEIEEKLNIDNIKNFIENVLRAKVEVINEITGKRSEDIKIIAEKIYDLFNKRKGNVEIKKKDEFVNLFDKEKDLSEAVDRFLSTKQNSDWFKLFFTAFKHIT